MVEKHSYLCSVTIQKILSPAKRVKNSDLQYPSIDRIQSCPVLSGESSQQMWTDTKVAFIYHDVTSPVNHGVTIDDWTRSCKQWMSQRVTFEYSNMISTKTIDKRKIKRSFQTNFRSDNLRCIGFLVVVLAINVIPEGDHSFRY